MSLALSAARLVLPHLNAHRNIVEARHFIGGKYVPSRSGKTFNLFNPATEEVVAKVPCAEQADISSLFSVTHTSKPCTYVPGSG